jgi:hypothetical protein
LRALFFCFFSLLAAAAGAPARKPAVFSIPLRGAEDVARFIVVGDAGTGDPHLHDGIVATTKRLHVDAILLLGDNVYPCGVASTDDPQWGKVTMNFADAGVPIYPVLGNHDYGDPTMINGTLTTCGQPSPAAEVEATGKVPHWIFPARHYALRSRLLDIVMLDTQPIASEFKTPYLGSETEKREIGWLTAALAGSHGKWRIVAGHHTIYSSGVHGFVNNGNQRHMRSGILEVLKQQNVDLYMCGHDHDAELIGHLHHKRGEPLFLVAGHGAHSDLMKKRTRADEPPTIFPAEFPPKPLVGFALLEVTAKKLSITFYDGLGFVRSQTFTVTRSSATAAASASPTLRQRMAVETGRKPSPVSTNAAQ